MQIIFDGGDLRKYRIELPNMADDDLDPFQFRLYAHYKRVCGGNGGICFESVRKTAERCQMSIDKVIATRQWLSDNNWIALSGGKQGTYKITILDRWEENLRRFFATKDQNLGVVVDRNIDQTSSTLIDIPINPDPTLIDISNEPPPSLIDISNQRRNNYLRKNNTAVAPTQQSLLDVEDLTPPAKKQPKQKAPKTEANPNTKPLVDLLGRLRGGNITSWAKEASWAKKIAESEVQLTQDELLRLVEGCFLWLRTLSRYWETKAISLSDVYEYLPQYKSTLSQKSKPVTINSKPITTKHIPAPTTPPIRTNVGSDGKIRL